MLRAGKTGASTKRVSQQLPKYKAVELLKLYIFEQIQNPCGYRGLYRGGFFISV
ncbi:MAG: hypothetical protein ACI4CY_03850 [Candidatus Gastranaerophilaceae bacterium]